MVERDPTGKVHIKQAVNLTARGAAAGGSGGAFWGTLVGLLFLNPLAGFAIGGLTGAGFGALSGMLADYGISDAGFSVRGRIISNMKSDSGIGPNKALYAAQPREGTR